MRPSGRIASCGGWHERNGQRSWLAARRARCLAALALLALRRAAAQTHLVIVSGLGGEKKYTESFAKLASTLADDGAISVLEFPTPNVLWFGEDSVVDEAVLSRAVDEGEHRARARADSRRAPAPAIRSSIVLIGHGSGEGDDTKISIPGPDLTRARLLAAARPFSDAAGRVREPHERERRHAAACSPRRIASSSRRRRARSSATSRASPSTSSMRCRRTSPTSTRTAASRCSRRSLRERRDEALLRERHAAPDGARAARRHGREGGRRRIPTARRARACFARRFFLDGALRARLAATIRSSPVCTRTSSRIEDRIDQLRAKKAAMTPDAVRRRARGPPRATRAQGEDDSRDRREEVMMR